MTAMMVQKLKEVTWGSSGRLFSALSFVVIYLNANLLGKKKVQNLINIQLPWCIHESEALEMVSHTETYPGKQGTSVQGRAGYSKCLN